MIEHFRAISILLDWSRLCVCACAFCCRCLTLFCCCHSKYCFPFQFQFRMFMVLRSLSFLGFSVIFFLLTHKKHLARFEPCKKIMNLHAVFPLPKKHLKAYDSLPNCCCCSHRNFIVFLLISVHSHFQSIASNHKTSLTSQVMDFF